jgi:nitrate/nitrite-specific signal transduction histidine kinase
MIAFKDLSLRIKIGVVFALIMLFAILNFLIFFIEQGNNKSLEIDIAGRNRMLSQSIAFNVEMVSKGHTNKAQHVNDLVILLDNSLTALKNGGSIAKNKETVTLIALGNEYDTYFSEIDNIWQPFKTNALQLANNNPSDSVAIRFIEENSDILLNSCNNLVSGLVKNTENNIAFTHYIFIIFLIVNILLVLLGLYVTYHYVVSPINRIFPIFMNMANGHIGQRIKVTAKDEIGILSESFNKMNEMLAKAVLETKERIIL